MKFRLNNTTVLLLALFPLFGAFAETESDLDTKRISRSVAYSLPLYHLNRLPLDENISTNAYHLFIDSLDPNRSFFFQSDIDTFNTHSSVLNKQLSKGNIDFSKTVYDILMKRIENRTLFIQSLLEKGFDTTIEEDFQWDREEGEWIKNEEEWNELWRKRIKNEYLARIVSKQVYTDEKNELDETNTVDSVNLDTNTLETTEEAYDAAAEMADLSPEEFILKRYE